jgi:hypothetical protein
VVVFALRSTDEKPPATLHPLAANPRYFADESGNPLYFSGSHNWANLVDIGRSYPPRHFDFDGYLDLLERHDHNFIRMWTFEQPQWAREDGTVLYVSPQPLRSGPGNALDGLPKFDLTLRSRVLHRPAWGLARPGHHVPVAFRAGSQFGTAIQLADAPFNRGNNVNGIDGDLNAQVGRDPYACEPGSDRRCEEYVRKSSTVQGSRQRVVRDRNESGGYSTDWQYSMIVLSTYGENGGKRHPVGMTFQWFGGDNAALLESEADWISPRGENYLDDPPVADGTKVVVFDNDHVCGVCPGESFVWKNFFRGNNPIYMDPLTGNDPV